MFHYQTKIKRNAGFTLVEMMVVILIISGLLTMGNWSNLSQRRERTRLEELAVQMVALIDQEKINTLLGKTEGGEIVRKREIQIDFNNPDTITYTASVNLTKDTEDVFTSPTSRTWTYNLLTMSLWNCDTGTAVTSNTLPLTTILQGDTMTFEGVNTGIKHIVIQLSRLSNYREIHIDRRTGVTYERESTTSTPTCT